MADSKRPRAVDDLPEVNPDGADLDGTAEIERQQQEKDRTAPGTSRTPGASRPTSDQPRGSSS